MQQTACITLNSNTGQFACSHGGKRAGGADVVYGYVHVLCAHMLSLTAHLLLLLWCLCLVAVALIFQTIQGHQA
jgi:hypothetical protein